MSYSRLLPNYAEFGRGRDKKKRKVQVKIHYDNIERALARGVIAGGLSYAALSTPQGEKAIAAGRRAAAGLRNRGATLVSAAGDKLRNAKDIVLRNKALAAGSLLLPVAAAGGVYLANTKKGKKAIGKYRKPLERFNDRFK